MKCKICHAENPRLFKAKILKKHKIDYFYCSNCHFLQTEEPYWLDEAYASSINLSDTGVIRRNISVRNVLSPLLLFYYGKNKKYLDYAGGYGILTRMMRDEGYNFYTNDPFTPNLIAKGFSFDINGTIIDEKIELLAAVECFEHYVNPIDEIEKMLLLAKNIYLTTKLLPNPVPNPTSWDYFGLNHGQHISLYSIKTLEFIANKYELNIYSIGNSHHLLTKKKINKYVFYLIAVLGKLGVIRWLRFFLGSKTMKDSEFLQTQ